MLFTVAYYATNIKSHAPRNPHFHECMALKNPRRLSPSPAHIQVNVQHSSKDKKSSKYWRKKKGLRPEKGRPDPDCYALRAEIKGEI